MVKNVVDSSKFILNLVNQYKLIFDLYNHFKTHLQKDTKQIYTLI